MNSSPEWLIKSTGRIPGGLAAWRAGRSVTVVREGERERETRPALCSTRSLVRREESGQRVKADAGKCEKLEKFFKRESEGGNNDIGKLAV